MDPELKELMADVKQRLIETSKVKDAVKQLEEQLGGLPATFERKLDAVRRMVRDDRGRYRGLAFQSEEEARGFGLYAMATVGRDAGSPGALKGEYREVFGDGSNKQQARGKDQWPTNYRRRKYSTRSHRRRSRTTRRS